MNTYIRQLSDIQKNEKQSFGGKAVNLAKMLSGGLPVPPGIGVGLGAFDEDGKLKKDSRQQINKYLNDQETYAVRSSAIAEDAEDASWAGQFETFLDIKRADVISKIEECHNSAKERAKAYADKKAENQNFDIAVVVQEMLQPEYAGVLFTKDPISGVNKFVTEYIEGLGEDLVSGKVDPKRITWLPGNIVEAPFDINSLENLAKKIEELFESPQDIEWAYAYKKIWIVQARPITVTQNISDSHNFGSPEELFYWGPSRTEPVYMSDWLAATEKVFLDMFHDAEWPNPPKTLVLFCAGKMVFLCNAIEFRTWCERSFEIYGKSQQVEIDIKKWQELVNKIPGLHGNNFSSSIVKAWSYTIIPEFSLYGAESSIAKSLDRFNAKTKQRIWGAFTVPDKPTFLSRIDSELVNSQNPALMAEKYPWIQDGYNGLSDAAEGYFKKRLELLGDEVQIAKNLKKERRKLAKDLELTEEEVKSLALSRRLAEFMDDRKAWMMQTRRLIKKALVEVENGWVYQDGKIEKIDEKHTNDLWQRYVNFKLSTSTVNGIVASNGGRHFINGEVIVISDPNNYLDKDKILVVPSTSPSYVPLMRKAKALITDHGGMMSHAAIVAREFNLPCIVGTKQATKILKNGDKIILDLVKGEIIR